MSGIKRLIILLLFTFSLVSSLSANADEFITEFCDSFVTESDFMDSARSLGIGGKVLIFNLEDSEVRAYNLHFDQTIGLVPIPTNVPGEAYDAIDVYHEVKNYYLDGVDIDTHAIKSKAYSQSQKNQILH